MRKALMAQFYNYVNAFVGKFEYSVVPSFTRFNFLSLKIFINKWVFTINSLHDSVSAIRYICKNFHLLFYFIPFFEQTLVFVNEIYSIIIRRKILFFFCCWMKHKKEIANDIYATKIKSEGSTQNGKSIKHIDTQCIVQMSKI